MADVPGRDELEGKLARALGKLLRSQMGRLLELMGDPPRIENVPPEFWETQGAEFSEAVRPFLQKLFQDQAARLISDTPFGVDWAQINERAVRWARAYTYELVSGINATTRQTLQRALGEYFQQQMTIGDLENMISGTFGPVRAEMIAVTEITRASARGEDALWDELSAQGIEMVTTWNTNNDELVCDICGPLHGQAADGRENGEPYWIHPETSEHVSIPAHPRCRCNENNELPEGKDPSETSSITNFENQYRNAPIEHFAAFDNNGNMLFEKSGERDVVRLTDAEREKLKGSVFTHNHPTGITFSNEDIKLGLEYGTKEIRAVSEKYDYMMRFFDSASTIPSWAVDQLDSLNDKHLREIYHLFENGTMTLREVNQEAAHNAITEWASRTEQMRNAIRYSRVEFTQ